MGYNSKVLLSKEIEVTGEFSKRMTVSYRSPYILKIDKKEFSKIKKIIGENYQPMKFYDKASGTSENFYQIEVRPKYDPEKGYEETEKLIGKRIKIKGEYRVVQLQEDGCGEVHQIIGGVTLMTLFVESIIII